MIRAMTASVAPSASEPESPMKIWAGWTLNHRNPSSAPMIERAQEGEVRLGRDVEQRDEQEGDEREDQRAAGQAVEAVGDVDAVARGDDRERGEEDVDRRVDPDGADERAPRSGRCRRSVWIWYAATNANTTCQRSFWRTLIPSPVLAFR